MQPLRSSKGIFDLFFFPNCLFAHCYGLSFGPSCHFFYQYIHIYLQEDLGTEYLVRPVARPEDEEDASDFEPEENGEEEDVHEEDEDDDEGAGKVEAPSKRKRSDRDGDSDDGDDDGGEDDERPSKRQGQASSWFED